MQFRDVLFRQQSDVSHADVLIRQESQVKLDGALNRAENLRSRGTSGPIVVLQNLMNLFQHKCDFYFAQVILKIILLLTSF